MQNVLLVVHMLACVSLVIAVLLQRSEGGALGMGGGGTGGLISGRGAASALVRITMGLAFVFICTSIIMTRLNAEIAKTPSDIQRELEQRNKQDPLASKGATPATTTPAPAAATPAPAPVDPLAPITPSTPGLNLTPAAPAPATTPPASTPATTTTTTTPAPKPAKPATVTPTPAPASAATTPAPAPTAPATSPTTPSNPPQN